jgi:hypothetical protein
MKWLQKLHNQPERIRQRVAIIGAIIVALVIFVVWAVSFAGDISQKNAERPADATGAFDAIGDIFSSGFDNLEDDLSEGREVLDRMRDNTKEETIETVENSDPFSKFGESLIEDVEPYTYDEIPPSLQDLPEEDETVSIEKDA